MNIEWDKVTKLSQIVAIIMGIAIFALGFYVGSEYRAENPIAAQAR